MSTFVDIVRYAEGGEILPLRREDVAAAIRHLPTYAIVEEEAGWAVKLPGTGLFAVPEGRTLSCQLSHSTDVDLLIDVLRKLASAIPGAVVQDEEGEIY